ncbi:MAG: radical SAM protein [Treponema sp.]|jgi:oxygen-independent coproporphyrinogen-3 oxidase|nr:radical SAM protein [Treponema sp.]
MLLPSILRVILTRSFKPFVFKNDNQERLFYQDLKNLGLYVHIPFCNTLCDFCPYFKIKYDEALVQKYMDALLKEIALVCSKQTEKKTASSLYFGGGTPALMLSGLQKIIRKLEEYFNITEGIGVELHPDDICENTLKALKAAGVSMLSIGVQSFDSECLNALERKSDNFSEKLKLVSSFNFSVVDVDLIFGIPKQTQTSLLNDIALAFAYGETQVSTYPFIDFTFSHNKYKPMPESVKKKMLAAVTEYAALNNIERTSVWTFAKKGTKRYSSVTRDSFLGFGPSSVTLLRNTFKINTFSIPAYIERVSEDHIPTSLTLVFTKRQRACYFLFWACYSMWIDSAVFKEMLGETPEQLFGAELWLGVKFGLLKKENGGYRVTDTGALFYHKMEQVYTTAYIDKSWNISRLHAFPEKIVLK